MYRILDEHDEACERRNQLRHPKHAAQTGAFGDPTERIGGVLGYHQTAGACQWTYFLLPVRYPDVFSRLL